jgi:hypothetical protein
VVKTSLAVGYSMMLTASGRVGRTVAHPQHSPCPPPTKCSAGPWSTLARYGLLGNVGKACSTAKNRGVSGSRSPTMETSTRVPGTIKKKPVAHCTRLWHGLGFKLFALTPSHLPLLPPARRATDVPSDRTQLTVL